MRGERDEDRKTRKKEGIIEDILKRGTRLFHHYSSAPVRSSCVSSLPTLRCIANKDYPRPNLTSLPLHRIRLSIDFLISFNFKLINYMILWNYFLKIFQNCRQCKQNFLINRSFNRLRIRVLLPYVDNLVMSGAINNLVDRVIYKNIILLMKFMDNFMNHVNGGVDVCFDENK